MYKILISSLEEVGKFSDVFSILEKEGCEVVKSPYSNLKEEDLLKAIKDIDGVIAGADEFTAKVIQAAKKLKIISRYGAGVEKIDIEAATKKGIVVTYTPSYRFN